MSLPAGCTSLVPGADAGFSFGGGGGGRQWRIQDFSEGGCLMSGPIRKVGGGGGGGGGSPLQVRYTKSGGGGQFASGPILKVGGGGGGGGGAVRFRSDTFVWHTATCTYLRTT